MKADHILFAEHRGYFFDGKNWRHPKTKAPIDLPRTMRLWHLLSYGVDVHTAVRLTVPRG